MCHMNNNDVGVANVVSMNIDDTGILGDYLPVFWEEF